MVQPPTVEPMMVIDPGFVGGLSNEIEFLEMDDLCLHNSDTLVITNSSGTLKS